MTTQAEIREWLLRGKEEGATHVIVAYDTFDGEDYPVFVMPDQNVKEKYNDKNGNNMQRVIEVYSLSMDLEEQLSEDRALHF